MTIYTEVLHVPYLHNLASAFPEHTFITSDWCSLRDKPDNVVMEGVPGDYRKRPVDIVIDSLSTFRNFELPCRLKVKLLHMERGFNSYDDESFIPDCVKNSDVVVSVSEHKKWTFGKEATRPTVVAIPFGVASVQIGRPIPGTVGSVDLRMNHHPQQARIWGHILDHFPDAQLTGFDNPYPTFEPRNYQEFNRRFSDIDVFVHTVVGNSVGLSFAEAMMRGIPVVTGMNLDLPKELVSGWNCYITRGNALDCLDEMVDAIKTIMGDRLLRMRIGHAARETAKRLWGLHNFRTNWNQVFNYLNIL